MILFESKPRLFGVIKEFNHTYGFVEGQDGQTHFCHWRDLPAAWQALRYRDQLPGRSVTFEPATRDGKRKAVQLFVIDEADETRIGAEIDVVDVR